VFREIFKGGQTRKFVLQITWKCVFSRAVVHLTESTFYKNLD